MDINYVLEDENVPDMHLVNGMYQPTITMTKDSPTILRMLLATGGSPLALSMADESAGDCTLVILAWDGIYLDSRLEETTVNLVAASRADVEVTCSSEGIRVPLKKYIYLTTVYCRCSFHCK